MEDAMTWLRWLLRRSLQRLGRRGVAGAVLIAACIAWIPFGLLPLQARVADLKATAVLEHARKPRQSSEDRQADAGSELKRFYAFFVRDDTLEDWLGRLHDIGARGGLQLQSAEYRSVDAKTSKLTQYQIVLPVTATYPQLKQFLAEALAAMPVLSLDEVSIRKRSLGDPEVEARLQFTLYLMQRT
jgi:hypothetical protein